MSDSAFEKVLNAVRNLPLPERMRLQQWLSRENDLTETAEGNNGSLRFAREMRWLDEHRVEYAGQWVALDGDRLIAAGKKAQDVFAAADGSGVELPLVVRVDETEALPFGGW
jgi:hypothetical protein